MRLIDDLETRSENILKIAVQLLRLLFIIIMILYLFDCLIGLSSKIVTLTVDHGTLDFPQIKIILTDSLFTMIVLAIVKSLFIRSNYVYAVTFLQIGFVVVMRKLILLEVDPGDTWLILVLGGLAVLFFLLIIYANRHEQKNDIPDTPSS